MNNIKLESDFEKHIREIISKDVVTQVKNLNLLQNKKAVDIIITRDDDKPTIFFIEIKYHVEKHGRLGIGHKKGGGFQPEILKLNSKFFNTNLKWIIGAENNEGYYLLNNSDIKKHLSGGEVADKFNNIQKKIFNEIEPINKDRLVNELINWMK